MSATRTSSGRARHGLAALIPTETTQAPEITEAPGDQQIDPGNEQRAADRSGDPLPVDGLRLITVDPASVAPNPRQPRRDFDADALAELAQSLTEVGMLQPIVVREISAGGDDGANGRDRAGGDQSAARVTHELVAGERRLRAARLAGLQEIPAVVRGTADNELLRAALLENLQRVQLNPLEEAASYEQLLTDFGGTHEELATRLGRSRPQISNTLRLLRLPPPVQRRVAAGVLSAGHARALLGLDDPAAMELVAKKIVAEGLSVRGVEELVAVGAPGKARRVSRGRAQNARPELDQLADRLSDRLDTRVRISQTKERGRITIEFAGIEDLHRIATVLGDVP